MTRSVLLKALASLVQTRRSGPPQDQPDEWISLYEESIQGAPAWVWKRKREFYAWQAVLFSRTPEQRRLVEALLAGQIVLDWDAIDALCATVTPAGAQPSRFLGWPRPSRGRSAAKGPGD